MAFMACTSLGCLISSQLSKNFIGQKYFAIITYIIAGTFYFIFLLSTEFLFVIICTCIMFFCTFVAYTPYFAYRTATYPTEIRATALGFIGICSKSGSISAPFIAGLVLENFNSESIVVVMCGIAQIISALFIFLIPDS
jgi:predicted MFS family arabinose efflux permease